MSIFSVQPRPIWSTPEAHVLVRVRTGSVAVDVGIGGREEVRAYAKRLTDFAHTLDADARDQIVYADPAELADIAKDYGTGQLPSVALLEARATKRGPAQTAKDIAWAREWRPFYVSLVAYQAQLQGFDLDGPSVTTAWTSLEGFETRLRAFAASYAALGETKPTGTLPTTFKTPSGQPDAEKAGPGDWVKPLAWAVGIFGGAWALSSLTHLVRG